MYVCREKLFQSLVLMRNKALMDPLLVIKLSFRLFAINDKVLIHNHTYIHTYIHIIHIYIIYAVLVRVALASASTCVYVCTNSPIPTRHTVSTCMIVCMYVCSSSVITQNIHRLCVWRWATTLSTTSK